MKRTKRGFREGCSSALDLRFDGYSDLCGHGSGFGFGVVLPARDLMVRAITPPGASGRVFGFVFVGLSIGSGLAGVVFGALVDAGGASLVFPVAGGLLVLAVVITTLAQMAANKPRAAA